MWLPFSTTAWIHFQFSFSVAVQSHYKTMKGYELESTPTKDIKSPYTCTNIDINTYDKHKLTKSLLTNALSLQVIEQSLRTNHDSALKMFSLWSTLFHCGKLNNLQSSSSPTQTLLTYSQPRLQFISMQAQLLHFLCLNFEHISDTMTNLKQKNSVDK